MQKKPQTMRSCQFQTCGYQLNPLDVKCTMVAGHACNEYNKCDPSYSGDDGCLLATAFIAEQAYKAGYCPQEALAQGTLYPELVRSYMQ